MYKGKTVSVIVPAYNEEETIAAVVADYVRAPEVDEVVVVDNNCKDRTAERAAAAGARVVKESKPGYGSALRGGQDAARGEILVLTEADGSFKARDLAKLLSYLEDSAMVLGTRTTRQMVEQGANMGKLLRWGNVTMAKILELLWYIPHEPRLTDVGCTYRALWADTWKLIRDGLSCAGPQFSPEMICEAYRHGLRVIEIPIHYYPREGGESKHSDSFWKVSKTALRMFRTILRKRFSRRPKKSPAPPGTRAIPAERRS
jgi:glycosyltransferase involved in cell wall biosynthesis